MSGGAFALLRANENSGELPLGKVTTILHPERQPRDKAWEQLIRTSIETCKVAMRSERLDGVRLLNVNTHARTLANVRDVFAIVAASSWPSSLQS